jgi:mannosyltransferase OCH1-like enzyme
MEDNTRYLIPRIIHYFWLGGKPKPESVIKCIDSWKKNCPGFEIKEWNEENYDVHKHPYMEKAYSEKKWAFVPDYGRLDVLYRYGGIYMDTDVEVLKDLSPLCVNMAYKGFENNEIVNDGQGFGCVPGMPIFKEMMACYNGDEPYETVNGIRHYIESPRLCTKVLLKYGLIQNGKRQSVAGIEIFPSDYFCPLDYDTGRLKITGNTYSIHHFDSSWHEGNTVRLVKIRHTLNRIFGVKRGRKIFGKIMHTKDVLKRRMVR